MKLLVLAVFVTVVAVIQARPQQQPEVTVVKYENDNIGVGGYSWNYQLSDGQSRQETAVLNNEGTENEALSVEGSYSFVIDGVTYTVTYKADENGYVADIKKSR